MLSKRTHSLSAVVAFASLLAAASTALADSPAITFVPGSGLAGGNQACAASRAGTMRAGSRCRGRGPRAGARVHGVGRRGGGVLGVAPPPVDPHETGAARNHEERSDGKSDVLHPKRIRLNFGRLG